LIKSAKKHATTTVERLLVRGSNTWHSMRQGLEKRRATSTLRSADHWGHTCTAGKARVDFFWPQKARAVSCTVPLLPANDSGRKIRIIACCFLNITH